MLVNVMPLYTVFGSLLNEQCLEAKMPHMASPRGELKFKAVVLVLSTARNLCTVHKEHFTYAMVGLYSYMLSYYTAEYI